MGDRSSGVFYPQSPLWSPSSEVGRENRRVYCHNGGVGRDSLEVFSHAHQVFYFAYEVSYGYVEVWSGYYEVWRSYYKVWSGYYKVGSGY